jgi:hypothetical protein
MFSFKAFVADAWDGSMHFDDPTYAFLDHTHAEISKLYEQLPVRYVCQRVFNATVWADYARFTNEFSYDPIIALVEACTAGSADLSGYSDPECEVTDEVDQQFRTLCYHLRNFTGILEAHGRYL